jgi:hypothetical protein
VQEAPAPTLEPHVLFCEKSLAFGPVKVNPMIVNAVVPVLVRTNDRGKLAW